MNQEIVQSDLIMEYFKKNPNREIKHPEIVDWVVAEYRKRAGKVFRDPDRAIRKLSQEGQLIKINKGVYKYEPDFVKNRKLKDFTFGQKEAIFKRDGYKCVVCGRGQKDGIEIHADHIKPRDLGGESTIENGQTLCAQHNFQKKNYKQTETGKKMFIRLYELAKKSNDKKLQKFCNDILCVYEDHDINCHIVWEK
ncbi:MAG: HNH endonuclease [Candidatus Omnitrophica bacterium]|nr:HNH endonuclease [Candidatus Omnitrophota bacterium]MBU1894527.1 HNH endonuclease [Candidatus Omnitrophota bacterium]